jgi:hypothetical protein
MEWVRLAVLFRYYRVVPRVRLLHLVRAESWISLVQPHVGWVEVEWATCGSIEAGFAGSSAIALRGGRLVCPERISPGGG